MTKKLFIWGLIIIVILLAGLLLINPLARSPDATALVPADTVLFVSLPDLRRTALRWQDTTLSKIANEPEVQAFLEKPLSRLNTDPGFMEALRILDALKPENIFAAITNASSPSDHALVGFRYRGNQKQFDEAVTRMRQELPVSDIPSTTEAYGNSEITISRHGPHTLCSASKQHWGFVSTSKEAIQFALDQIKNSHPDTLANSPRYRTVLSHLQAGPDLLLFLQPEKLIDEIQKMGQATGAQAIPEDFAKLRSTQAIGATFKLDKDLQRDAIFVLRPTTKTPSLNHKPIQLTNSDTTFYFDLYAQLEDLPAYLQKTADAGAALRPELVAAANLASAAYGPEFGMIINWAQGQMAPVPLLAVEIRDENKANDCLQQLLHLFPETAIMEENGVKIYSFSSIASPLTTLTLTQTPSFLLLSLNSVTVSEAARMSTPHPTLKDSPTFEPALKYYQSANAAFGFIDARTVFERLYETFRPVVIFSAAVIPQYADFIDTTKLPETEIIARHLSPIIFSQQCLADGTLIESSGPITMNQVTLTAAASAMALFYNYHLKDVK